MTQKTYSCPKCGRDVTTENINVAKDILLCPHCGETSSFSALIDLNREREESDTCRRLLSAPPPKHLKLESDPTDMTGRLRLIYRKFSPAAIFLIPFTAAWSGFSMTGIYGSQITEGRFDLSRSLFGLPFLIGTIVLVSSCLFCICGKRVLTLERGKGSYFFGVGPFGWTRRFTYDRRTRVEEGVTSYHSRNSDPAPELHLTHPDTANTVRICAGMHEDALDYIKAVLEREISRV